MVVILGNAGNIGYLAAKAEACQEPWLPWLHEAGEESRHNVDCLRSSHLAAPRPPEPFFRFGFFAGLVHTVKWTLII